MSERVSDEILQAMLEPLLADESFKTHCVHSMALELIELRKQYLDEVLATHSGKDARREWHNLGAWLYPGDSIVVLRKAGDADA